jgi:hypothetical protein
VSSMHKENKMRLSVIYDCQPCSVVGVDWSFTSADSVRHEGRTPMLGDRFLLALCDNLLSIFAL